MDKCFKCITSAPILNDAGRFAAENECFDQNKRRFDSDRLFETDTLVEVLTTKNHAVFDEDCVLCDIFENFNLDITFMQQSMQGNKIVAKRSYL